VSNVLALKLQQYAALGPQDVHLVSEATGVTTRLVRPREDVVREGDRPQVVRVILDGWAVRYKMLPDGRRQIISILLPGDLCDLNVYLLDRMDHSIGSISTLTIAELGREQLDLICEESPTLCRALWLENLVTTAVQREWTVNLGQRTARERMAHLFCELFFRLKAVGMTESNRCEMPLTQTDLSEATGMTAVHANRTLQDLRRSGLIELQSRMLTIKDLDALIDVAMFNRNYLHQGTEQRVNQ
jgi:CRP-like cAMP-binding protein